MKANEVPERLYLSKLIYGTFLYQSPDPDDKTEVGYTHTDAFIEKACEWLTNNLTNYYLNPVILNDVIHDFKQAMKGE